jgi:hypothetical protein
MEDVLDLYAEAQDPPAEATLETSRLEPGLDDLRRVVGLTIDPDEVSLGQDLPNSRKLACQGQASCDRLTAAVGFGHAGDVAARVILGPIVDGPDGERAALGGVPLGRQNVEGRIAVAHWSMLRPRSPSWQGGG